MAVTTQFMEMLQIKCPDFLAKFEIRYDNPTRRSCEKTGIRGASEAS